MRKLIAVLLMFILTINSVAVSAKTLQNNYKEIILSEKSYYDEETASDVLEVITITPLDQRGISGSAHIRKKKTHTWSGGEVMTYYVEGDFVFDDDEDYIHVSNKHGNVYGYPSSATISNRSLTEDYGTYFWFFNNYVDIEFSFTTTDILGISRDYSVCLRVSEEGVAS